MTGRRWRRSISIGLVATAAGTLDARAQVAPAVPAGAASVITVDTANGLTLADAIQRALERAPALRSAEAEVDEARGLRVQAGLRPNPALSVQRQEQVRGADTMTALDVMWPLDLLRRSERLALADRGIEAAAGSLAARRRATARAVAAAYGEWLVATGRLDITDRFLQTLEQTFDLVAARVENGAAPVLERNVAEVALLQARAERFTDEADVIAARGEVLRLMGAPIAEAIAPRDTLEGVVAALAGRTRLPDATAAARLPDVLAAQARIRLAEAGLRAIQSEARPEFGMLLGYSRTATGFPFRAYDATGMLMPIDNVMNSVSFGITVSLPVRDRRQGASQAARASLARARFDEQAEVLMAETTVAVASGLDRAARQSLAVFNSGLRDLARRNLEVIRETYSLGAATLVDVLQEQRRVFDVESAYLRALGRAYTASTAVLDALGDLR